MKALILAAGFGTRLKPYTNHTPKPLFTIGGRPLLDHIIGMLHQAGCRSILINTHHLHQEIEAHVRRQDYPVRVQTRYEPEILGTGGAIRNAADFWDDAPFVVINGDILTDIDLGAVIRFHQGHSFPATLVLHDFPMFNQVAVDRAGVIQGFHPDENREEEGARRLAFTGIQVLSPRFLNHIPARGFVSSIDVYREMIARGETLKAHIAKNHYWMDIGTPERYRQAAVSRLAQKAFGRGDPLAPAPSPTMEKLAGDGSDRAWFRLGQNGRTLVLADHGIKERPGPGEADAFVAIGRHLRRKNLPVPRLIAQDTFAGLVVVEDLGNVHLERIVHEAGRSEEDILRHYRPVVGDLARLGALGAEGFDTGWTCQTRCYDRELILERECRYFTDAFLNGCLGLGVAFESLAPEFDWLADQAIQNAVQGFIHRDMQSRNILVHQGSHFFIDFQGGRLGPVQYDLASLLIDPYAMLPETVQDRLLEVYLDHLARYRTLDRRFFMEGYRACAITRNLQILGAFGFLSRVKGKTRFEAYIPPALAGLAKRLEAYFPHHLPGLKAVVQTAAAHPGSP